MQRFTLLQDRRSCIFTVVFSLAVTALPHTARAQADGAARGGPADKLWDEAGAAMDKQDYATACPKIEEVVRLRPDGLGAKLKLAKCYEGAGRLASAWALWQQIEPLAQKANQPERQNMAHERAEALKPKLATLAIVVPEALRTLPGIEVTCDGKVVEPGQWGVPLPVDKGRHVIGVTATGRERGERVAEVPADGVARTVTVDPPAAVAPPEPKRSVVPTVVLGTLAAGGLISGVVFTALLSATNSAADAVHAKIVAHHGSCAFPGTLGYDDLCPDLVAKGKTENMFYDAAVGAFVVGGAAAAGTALYLLWPSLRPKTAAPRVVRDIRLMPILGPNSHGLLVSGSF